MISKRIWLFLFWYDTKPKAYIPLSTREITKVWLNKPVELLRGIEGIFSHLRIKNKIQKIFHDNYIEFLEELAYRFYQVTSERSLALITEKPKDRYYRLLDAIYTNKREMEDLIYYALINSGKIIKKEVKIDITSTYFEGNNLSIALFGYSMDHREDRRQVVILLVLVDDYPLFTYVFEGNKKDWAVLLDVIKDVKERIGCSKITIVCDEDFSW
ncbi:MAG: hypothetical protein QXD15_00990, partial [Thermoplasmata archaeon]